MIFDFRFSIGTGAGGVSVFDSPFWGGRISGAAGSSILDFGFSIEIDDGAGTGGGGGWTAEAGAGSGSTLSGSPAVGTRRPLSMGGGSPVGTRRPRPWFAVVEAVPFGAGGMGRGEGSAHWAAVAGTGAAGAGAGSGVGFLRGRRKTWSMRAVRISSSLSERSWLMSRRLSSRDLLWAQVSRYC